ncbi:MAG TPA: hypothetical protein VMD27_13820 [Candidatus Aquilonibacter sp.]|nr:hypothetical protein [Candidatus Aquilonibacter sp.]HUB87410.1 hypothetical protein [Verrucomicrobiae bacterium]
MNLAVLKKASFAALAALMLAGCATEQIDWTPRIGHYTYSQAVKDYGPPDKSAKLSDGSTVAEWMTDPGQTVVSPGGPYWVSPRPGFGTMVTPGYTVTRFPSTYLQLIFKPDGTLAAEKEISK